MFHVWLKRTYLPRNLTLRMGARPVEDWCHWTAEACPFVVDYSREVAARIHTLATTGQKALAHGGIEHGGLLVGRRDGNHIFISDFLELPCEHALSPRLILSDHDKAAVREMIQKYETAPAIEIVGWFVCHTRTDLGLTENDTAFHREFFDRPGKVAMAVKPRGLQPTEAAFFFVNEKGEFARAGQAFTLPQITNLSGGFTPPPEGLDELMDRDMSFTPPVKRERDLRELDLTDDRPGKMKTWFLAAGLLVLAALCGAYLSRDSSASGSGRLLTLDGLGGALVIRWNHLAKDWTGATGRLEIADGDTASQNLTLNAADLERGVYLYRPQSDFVRVRLRIEREGAIEAEDSSVFVAAKEAKPSAPPKPEPPPLPVVEEQETRVEEVAVAKRAPKVFRPPRVERSAPALQRLNMPEPSVSVAPPPVNSPQIAVSNLPAAAVSPPPPPPKPAPETKPAAPPPRPVEKPRSGRIIWTGNLPAQGTLTIQNWRPSSGSLTGLIPDGPVRVRAKPAELTEAGIIVYGPEVRSEAPGPLNGWNRTEFRSDRERDGDVRVTEMPAAGNQWSRIVLRGGRRPLSVVFLEWEVCPECGPR